MSCKQKPSFTLLPGLAGVSWGFMCSTRPYSWQPSHLTTVSSTPRKRGQSVPALSRNPTAGSPACLMQRTALGASLHQEAGLTNSPCPLSVRYRLTEVGGKTSATSLEGNVPLSLLPAIRKLNYLLWQLWGVKKWSSVPMWASTGLVT